MRLRNVKDAKKIHEEALKGECWDWLDHYNYANMDLALGNFKDAINKYNIKVNGYDAVKNNLIRARDDLSTDALRLENRLLFNSSYFL